MLQLRRKFRVLVFTGFIRFLFFIITALIENTNLSINGRNTILPAVIDFDGDDKLCKPILSHLLAILCNSVSSFSHFYSSLDVIYTVALDP